jgi:hypothetical protein
MARALNGIAQSRRASPTSMLRDDDGPSPIQVWREIVASRFICC